MKKYFNLKEYLIKMKLHPLIGVWLLIITATRNMGKSYGTWDFIEKEIWEKYNYTKKIIYCRTNIEKLKKAAASFNANYMGKYKVESNKIYKINLDEKGKEIIADRIHIGDFVDIMNEHNYRSGAGKNNFKDYIFAFWDEFNEDTQIEKSLFNKWLMLFSTLKRQNNPFLFVIIGNKINANNDIFIKLELDTDTHNLNNDYIQEIISPKSKTKIGYYLDIGFDTFKHLNPNGDIVRALAEFDNDTDTIFNEGGFLKGQAYNVLIYTKYIKPTKKILMYFIYNELIIEYGTFGNNNEFIYFHKIIEEEMDKDKKCIALNMLGYMGIKCSNNLDRNEYIDLINYWGIANKNKLLYFTSFDLKLEIEKVIITLTDIFKK